MMDIVNSAMKQKGEEAGENENEISTALRNLSISHEQVTITDHFSK
jgi:hypothetical protein